MKILITGGLGYIGSHLALELIDIHEVHLIDLPSKKDTTTYEKISKHFPEIKIHFSDLLQPSEFSDVFDKIQPEMVIHLSALTLVNESTKNPLTYYDSNLRQLSNVLTNISKHQTPYLIFSSSSSVYGSAKQMIVSEDAPLIPTSPYASSKVFCEQIIQDFQTISPFLKTGILRYFNPLGTDTTTALLNFPSSSIFSNILKIALTPSDMLTLYGKEYPTPDHTAIRDYIDIRDLSSLHSKVIDFLTHTTTPLSIFNAGSGVPTSLLELLKTFENATNISIPYTFQSSRKGDVPAICANMNYTNNTLEWSPQFSLPESCANTWKHYQEEHSNDDQKITSF